MQTFAILVIALSVPSISLRWLARCKSSKLGWDDHTAMAGTFCLLALAILQLKGGLRNSQTDSSNDGLVLM